jgi:hypothetical protein
MKGSLRVTQLPTPVGRSWECAEIWGCAQQLPKANSNLGDVFDELIIGKFLWKIFKYLKINYSNFKSFCPLVPSNLPHFSFLPVLPYLQRAATVHPHP